MRRNEADTRTQLIDPALHARGWTEDLIRREETTGTVEIVDGQPRRQGHGRTDYTLRVKVASDAQAIAVAILEAKDEGKSPAYGLDQAKVYGVEAKRLNVPFVIATNGHLWTLFDRRSAKTTPLPRPMGEFPTPDELRTAYEDAVGIDLSRKAQEASHGAEYLADLRTQWCPVQNVLCLYNDLGLIGVGSNPPADWNQYFTGSVIEIDGSKTKSNQIIGQVVYRYGRTSNLDAGAITAKPAYVTFTGADCGALGYTCRSYNVIEVGVGSDHGDSGSGFYRVQSDGYGGYTRNAYGILSGGKTGYAYTYYYAWDEPFYAGVYKTDRRTVSPCISTSCPL